jgi:hypothetical protein
MRRSSPDLLTWSGFVLYALSAAFLVAVIHLLGRVWTVKLLIARDHVLVDQGLFRIVKHPNYFLNTEAITSPTTLDSKIKKLEIHKSLQTLLKPPTHEGEHEFHESRESPDDESVYFDILSSTYEWHSACISKKCIVAVTYASARTAMRMTFKIERLVGRAL